MEEHLIVVWGYDTNVSIIGESVESLYRQYAIYHQEEKMSPRAHAVHIANWFSVRGCQVYIYPYEDSWKEMASLKLFLGLGKRIGEVRQGVILGKPNVGPEVIVKEEIGERKWTRLKIKP